MYDLMKLFCFQRFHKLNFYLEDDFRSIVQVFSERLPESYQNWCETTGYEKFLEGISILQTLREGQYDAQTRRFIALKALDQLNQACNKGFFIFYSDFYKKYKTVQYLSQI